MNCVAWSNFELSEYHIFYRMAVYPEWYIYPRKLSMTAASKYDWFYLFDTIKYQQ